MVPLNNNHEGNDLNSLAFPPQVIVSPLANSQDDASMMIIKDTTYDLSVAEKALETLQESRGRTQSAVGQAENNLKMAQGHNKELQAKVNTLKAKAKELETDYHIKYKSIAERQHKKEQQD